MMKWLILFTLIATNLVDQLSPVLKIEQGLLRGRVSSNGQFYEYLGIPYGTTTPNTRFQAPLPAPKWNGTYNAVNENSYCPQRRLWSHIGGEEDCLKLNVFVPTNAGKGSLLPVMFYIHGGGFFEGRNTPLVYGPEFFVHHDIILVTVNYRLNIQGFLCLGIKEAPGNAGLKDQIAALRWVKKNIKAFGGDPDNVTIFGESAGAVSTSLLTLSPLTKGLFNKAIMQSGTSLVPWGLQQDPIEQASSLARAMGYYSKDPYELHSYFMNSTYQDLILTRVPRDKGNSIVSELIFVPCIEKKIAGVESVITEEPYNIITSKKYLNIPTMIGYNSNEGILFAALENETSLEEMKIEKIIPPDLYVQSETDKNNIIKNISSAYFSGNKANDDVLRLSDFYGDIYFAFPAVRESLLRSKNSENKVYNYIFGYDGLLNLPKRITRLSSAAGATHADELFYMFKTRVLPILYKISDNLITDRLTKMWTDFAKYGNPTPESTELLPVEWIPNKDAKLQYMIIDQNLKMGPMPKEQYDRFLIWNEVYSKHRRKIPKWKSAPKSAQK